MRKLKWFQKQISTAHFGSFHATCPQTVIMFSETDTACCQNTAGG